jgi:NTP pyrophosphatase (non-canonical NTP hydrolase)
VIDDEDVGPTSADDTLETPAVVLEEHLEQMMTFSLKTMQTEHRAWSEKNFGKQQPGQMLLGLFEEFGELDEASNLAEAQDAVGDVMIYMSSYCTLRGWDLEEIFVTRPHGGEELPKPMQIVRRLSHAQLKSEQGIRGSSEKHAAVSKLWLGKMLHYVEEELALFSVKGSNREAEFLSAIEATWNKVSKRDWTKDKLGGGEKPL